MAGPLQILEDGGSHHLPRAAKFTSFLIIFGSSRFVPGNGAKVAAAVTIIEVCKLCFNWPIIHLFV